VSDSPDIRKLDLGKELKMALGSNEILSKQGGFRLGEMAETRSNPPCCAVCGKPLGGQVTLDATSTREGGEFRLTCDDGDEAHTDGVAYWIDVEPGQKTAFVLKHVGAKSWADPTRVFDALWPWLREQHH